jgi:hypothetical protein
LPILLQHRNPATRRQIRLTLKSYASRYLKPDREATISKILGSYVRSTSSLNRHSVGLILDYVRAYPNWNTPLWLQRLRSLFCRRADYAITPSAPSSPSGLSASQDTSTAAAANIAQLMQAQVDANALANAPQNEDDEKEEEALPNNASD